MRADELRFALRFVGWQFARVGRGSFRCRLAEELARAFDSPVAAAVGQQPVVADFDEPRRQDVEAEPPQELVESEGHGFALRVVRVVLVGESDGAGGLVEGEEAAVADGDAVGVAGKVGEHLPGSAERALGIDVPFGAAGIAHQPGKGARVGLRGEFSVELQLALRVEGLEPVAVFGGEDHRESPHGKEVV